MMEPPSPPASPRRGGRVQHEASDEAVLLTEPTLLQRLIKAASRRENAEVRSAAAEALPAAPALRRSGAHAARAAALRRPAACAEAPLRMRAVLCGHSRVACCVCGRLAGADGASGGCGAALCAQTLRPSSGALNSGARHAGWRVNRRCRLEPDKGGIVRGDELAEQPRGLCGASAARGVHLPARGGGPPRRAGQLRQVRRQQRRAGAGAHCAGAPRFAARAPCTRASIVR